MGNKKGIIFIILAFCGIVNILFNISTVKADNNDILLKTIEIATNGYPRVSNRNHEVEDSTDKSCYLIRASNFVITNTFSADKIEITSDNPSAVDVVSGFSSYSSGNLRHAYHFVTNGIGDSNITVKATNSSTGKSSLKKYVVHSCDVVTKLKVNNQNILVNQKKTLTDIQGINKDNYFTNKYTNVSLMRDSMTYVVQDPSILKIDKAGHMTGLKTGRTTVTVKYRQSYYTYLMNPNTNKLEEYSPPDEITVSFAIEVNNLVEKIIFNTKLVTLNKNQVFIQQPRNYPLDGFTNKNYIWTSSNPDIATVDKTGKVQTRLTGITIITAKSTDGSNKSSDYTIYVKGSAPNKVITSKKKTYIKVSWDAMADTQKYKVYRSTSFNGTYSYIGSSTQNSYNDKKCTYNKTYYYKIVTVPMCSVNCASDLSTSYSKRKFSLSIPKIKTIKKSSNGYRIKIKGTKYTGFVIYAGKKKNNKKMLAIIKGKSATVFLNKNTKYYIRCRAFYMKNNKRYYSTFSKTKKYITK